MVLLAHLAGEDVQRHRQDEPDAADDQTGLGNGVGHGQAPGA